MARRGEKWTMRRKRNKPPPRIMTQREAIALMEANGWARETGGRHQVKMVKPGHRPIPLPHNKGRPYPVNLTRAILKQAGLIGGSDRDG